MIELIYIYMWNYKLILIVDPRHIPKKHPTELRHLRWCLKNA